MALVTCIDCGREVSDRAKTCPNCGAPMEEGGEAAKAGAQGPEVQKVSVVDPSYQGGYEAGYGCMTLATSRPVAYLAFILAWMFGGTFLAARRGLIADGQDPPLGVGLAIVVLPFILAYVLRKPIQKVMPVLLGSGCAIILLIPAFILTLWVVGEFLGFLF